MPDQKRILVIKHGALGDIIKATGLFFAIRCHHPDAHHILLTTPPFVELARQSAYFDDIWIDHRSSLWRPDRWVRLRHRLIKAAFHRVYDLQGSQRTGLYFRMIPASVRPEWMHATAIPTLFEPTAHASVFKAIRPQLFRLPASSGIGGSALPDLGWLDAQTDDFTLHLPDRLSQTAKQGQSPLKSDQGYVLLMAGCSRHRSVKRWPAESYGRLANALVSQGVLPVLIGTYADQSAIEHICDLCPQARNLCGLTTIAQLAALARGARYAVANDTGPAHLAAVVGCPILVIFSDQSDPVFSAPCGPCVYVIKDRDLAELSAEEVMAAVQFLEPGS